MVPSLLRISTSDGAYDATDDLVEEEDESEDDSGMELASSANTPPQNPALLVGVGAPAV